MSQSDLISLRDRGWRVIGRCVAVIRLFDRPGFAVGVQEAFCRDGTGRVWPNLKKARDRAAYLAKLHKLPVVESI
jgi:predicted CoA-binding protein